MSRALRAPLLGLSLAAAGLSGGCAAAGPDDALSDEEELEALDAEEAESEVLEARVVGSARDGKPSSTRSGGGARVAGVTRDTSPSGRGGVGKVTRTVHDTSGSSRGGSVSRSSSGARDRGGRSSGPSVRGVSRR